MSSINPTRIREVFEKVGASLEIPKEFLDSIKVDFVTNKRFYGNAIAEKHHVYKDKYKLVYRIQLSCPLLSVSDDNFKDQTYAHELCHVFDYHLNRNMNHGDTWKSLMVKAGYSTDVLGPALPAYVPGMVTVRCLCKTFPITSNKATRMRKGSAYKCSVCNQRLEFV